MWRQILAWRMENMIRYERRREGGGEGGGRPEEPQEEYFTFYGAGVVGVAPDKKSVSPPAKSERECIKLRITTNRTLTAHAYYNGTSC